VIAIAAARALPDDSSALVEGVLTTVLGALEDGRTGFVQDDTAGIAIYLDTALEPPIAAGRRIRVGGTLDSLYGQRTIRVEAARVDDLGPAAMPAVATETTGSVGESLEGSRVSIAGILTEAPSALADGTGLLVDDGSGPVRAVVAPGALGGITVARGSSVSILGPVGQRDSSGTGTAGYRVFATLPGEFAVTAAEPTPTPMPTPTPTPSVTPTPSPTSGGPESPAPTASGTPSLAPSPSPSTGPSPTPTSDVRTIVDVRGLPAGTRVHVRGVVTAEAGRIGTPALVVIGDGTAGLAIRLPKGVAEPVRGSLLDIDGPLAAPYGQLEVRPAANGIAVIGTGALPGPIAVSALDLGESTEGSLVSIDITLDRSPTGSSSGDLSTSALDPATGQRLAVAADSSSGLVAGDLAKGGTAHIVGVVGQRASRVGKLDGYRIWLRDRADVTRTTSPGASATPTPRPSGPTPAPPRPTVPIAEALLRQGATVRVQGTVTAADHLLDSAGRVVTIQDASAAIAVRLPKGAPTPLLGRRLRIDGTVGRAYGAPRIDATGEADLGRGVSIIPLVIRSSPGVAHEWRLVRATGTLADVHRDGHRWRADLVVGSKRIAISGVAAAGVAASGMTEGRAATVVGIVRRPYPTATDRRFAIVPRTPADLRLGPAAGPHAGTAAGGSSSGGGGSTGGASTVTPGGTGSGPEAADVDVATLAEHVGEIVRVGGFVVTVDQTASAFELDDGTATGLVVLDGDSRTYVALLTPGDALNATGRVVVSDDLAHLVVASAADLVRVEDLGAAEPTNDPATDASPSVDQAPVTGDPGNGTASLTAALGVLPIPDPTSPAGFASIMLVSTLSLVVTLGRRWRSRRLAEARVAARLAGIGAESTTHVRPSRTGGIVVPLVPDRPAVRPPTNPPDPAA
jgi:hypothetical protein